MTTSADIFEALAASPDRTPAQRRQDLASAAILRDRAELFGEEDEQETWTSEEVDHLVAEELRELLEELAPGAKRARALVQARIDYRDLS